MLPDFGWSELLVIAIVLIVIVGPKDLPKMLAHVRQDDE
jgi:sec-independent protein translocase protein TatB